ncbi:phospholipase D-like domain-containing protein [Aquabacter spiritensis]|uniref:Phospholipase D n=1 Tax=Aquabacter spiritensis TaxID=933073 RepID=A0A4V2UXE4_9HYPH|nr:phospholipase D-like domain-containing protein [Aquabacter spiritensis]TCT03208.1 phosphatidylserine/phosphatidylglycerophosphate/cardiolipin synthase-like enzyme [Aquabacter spiritensis]
MARTTTLTSPLPRTEAAASGPRRVRLRLPAWWRRAPAVRPAGGDDAILVPGWNCWKRARADRAALLVDGAAYFARLEAALRRARHSIVIVGWDFDSRVKLRPDTDDTLIGTLLRRRVEAEPDLSVRILVWSSAVVHAPSAPSELLIGDESLEHPRIQLRLDTTHPFYAAHHQKIVCIDGALAFVGGMDLTVDRWDTSEHLHADPHRVTPGGAAYGPVHDTHLMLDGDAARSICALAHTRWAEATGEDVPFTPEPVDLWPHDLSPDFAEVDLGISRVMPEWGGRTAIEESPRLTGDALRAARRTIFIEAQYLTAGFVAEILEQRLREPDGPDVVAVVSRAAHTLPERLIMGENRDRLIRRLTRADRHDRFRIYHPVVPAPEDECAILIHSKLILVDDRFLRVGSSNLNNRSIGLDTELDIAVEAGTSREREAIAAIRDRLIGEHLGTAPAQVRAAMEETGSLVKTIERLNRQPRGLRQFDAIDTHGPTQPVIATWLLDPARPFEPIWMLKQRKRRR